MMKIFLVLLLSLAMNCSAPEKVSNKKEEDYKKPPVGSSEDFKQPSAEKPPEGSSHDPASCFYLKDMVWNGVSCISVNDRNLWMKDCLSREGMVWSGLSCVPDTQEGFNQTNCIQPAEAVKQTVDLLMNFFKVDSCQSLYEIAKKTKSMRNDIAQSIHSLTPFAWFPQLTTMTISISAINDISPYANLKYLQQLVLLDSVVLYDITPLAYLQELKTLEFDAIHVQNISTLKNLKNLESLAIRFADMEDYTPLFELKNLQRLSLFGIASDTNLSFLEKLKYLKEFAISPASYSESQKCPLDLSPLNNLINATAVDLSFGCAEDLSFLQQGLPWQVLNLHANRITDISSIKNLSNLKVLIADFNKIEDLAPLGQLPSLSEIHLIGNPVKNLNPLEGLAYLLILLLEKTPIADGIVKKTTENCPQSNTAPEVLRKFCQSN